MSLIHKVINCNRSHSETAEYNAAKELENRLVKWFNNFKVDGYLYILSNVTIYGYRVRDIDILILCKLKGCVTHGDFRTLNHGTVNTLSIDSFITTIELKDHPADKIYKQGTSYVVTYKNNVTKDASHQSEDQKYSILNYIIDNFNVNPFITNLLWLRSLNSEQLKAIRRTTKDNALSSEFKFNDFVNALLLDTKVYLDHNGIAHINNLASTFDLNKFISTIAQKYTAVGLTKRKFELIVSQQLDINELAANVNGGFTILSGRAGTGKTIRLLQLAYYYANHYGKRCLLLTYNNALVSDIKRLIDFTDMPIGMEGKSINIQTVNSFFGNVMKLENVIEQTLVPEENDYDKKFEELMNQLNDHIKNILSKKGIKNLKDLKDSGLDWDYVLIDEAQDWTDIDKETIINLYGTERIIVADGIDQFIRSNQKQDWCHGIQPSVKLNSRTFKLEMRQKSNIVRFINAYAEMAGLDWYVTPNDKITGGKIDIYHLYDSDIHSYLCENCRANGCEDYDILILVPPKDVVGEPQKRHFRLADAYHNANIKIYDGTQTANRYSYPVRGMSRVFQYDSCRGLEGWAVVCTKFDELITYKLNTEKNLKGLANNKSVFLWSLMPLTRAVDTLVITLQNPKSKVGLMLHSLANNFKDFVNWNIKEDGVNR